MFFSHHFTDLIIVTNDLYWHHLEITCEVFLLLLLLLLFFFALFWFSTENPRASLFPAFLGAHLFKMPFILWATQKISELITVHCCCLQPMNANLCNYMPIPTYVCLILYSLVYSLDPSNYFETSFTQFVLLRCLMKANAPSFFFKDFLPKLSLLLLHNLPDELKFSRSKKWSHWQFG